MTKTEVLTKAANYRLFQAGCFGTKLRTWRNLGELENSDYFGDLTIRYLEPGSPWCRYSVPRAGVEAVLDEFWHEGAELSKFVFGESAPDEDLIIQGEVAWLSGAWHLFYSTEKAKMRDALKNGKHLQGFAVLHVLREFLTPSSYEDIMALFDAYKDPVVEFSTYRRTLGQIPGRNTIVWEVRTGY